MKPQMQWNYLFKHWFATLLIAPFLSDLFLYINPANSNIGGFVSVYPIVFIISLIYSAPTYVVYALFFYFLKKETVAIIYSKIILIIIAAIGVILTFLTTFGLNDELPILLGYICASILTGIFFKLEKTAN